MQWGVNFLLAMDWRLETESEKNYVMFILLFTDFNKRKYQDVQQYK